MTDTDPDPSERFRWEPGDVVIERATKPTDEPADDTDSDA